MPITAKKLGERIKMLRELKQLTQESLAEHAETTSQYISSLERGLQNVTLSTLEKVAEALGVEIFSLFSFDSTDALPSKQSIKKLIDQSDAETFKKFVKMLRASSGT